MERINIEELRLHFAGRSWVKLAVDVGQPYFNVRRYLCGITQRPSYDLIMALADFREREQNAQKKSNH